MKRLIVAAAVLVAAAAVASAVTAAPPPIKLKPVAGNIPPPAFDKLTGNGTYSQAQWTNKQAHTGKFSVLLQKSVDFASCYTSTPQDGCAAFAGIEVKGVEGMNANGHTIGYWFKGDCAGGSPRMNLFYDNDGDGQYDGYKFLADCTTGGAADANGWRQVTDNTSGGVTVGAAMAPTATIVELDVIVDNKQTTYVDDVQFDTTVTGEPSGS
jgi:opacity protein-like surface antigen